MMKKLHRNRYKNVVVAMMMVFFMFVGMGTIQVHAAEYTTGTFDPAQFEVGDKVYKGIQLSSDRQAVVCKKCNMVWLTTGTSYGIGDMKRSEVAAMEAHKDHAGNVGYSLFNWYFSFEISGPLLKDTPYTIVENENNGENNNDNNDSVTKWSITYDTNGGSPVAAETDQTNLPDPLPTTTKDGYDFAGWYTDEDFVTAAQPGQAITADTTLYAKWVEHSHIFKDAWSSNDTSHWHEAACEHTTEKKDEAAHVYGAAGTERYTCTVCGYVSETRKNEAEAADKNNTENSTENNTGSETVSVKRTEANDVALNTRFNVKTGKTIWVTWGKVADADGYDVYMAYCGKDKEKLVKSVKSANSLSVEISKLKKKKINQKNNIKCHVLAYKMVDGRKVTVAKSITIHAAGKKNGSVTDAKSIKLKKASYVLAKGKKAAIKASIVKKDKKLPIIKHTQEFRYATSDSKVAVVSKNGKITAKGKGSCSIYVYAANGCAKRIKVVVK